MPPAHWIWQFAVASHSSEQYSTQRMLHVDPALHSARPWSPRTNVQLLPSEQARLAFRPVISAQWLIDSHSAAQDEPQLPTHVMEG